MKSNYSDIQIQHLISEELFCYVHQGIFKKNHQPLLIREYKKEYLSPQLIRKLIYLSEKLVNIQHPNIEPFLGYEFDGKRFFTYVPLPKNCISLETYLQKKSNWDVRQLWQLSTQILAALLKFEAEDIIHGQLNLQDIWIQEDNTVLLTQSAIPSAILKRKLTEFDILDHAVFLTPEFLDKQELSQQFDMYAFGVLSYFLFSKKWPFTFTMSLNKLKHQLLQPFAPFQSYDESLPDRIQKIIQTCLQVEPQNRFQSFQDLVQRYKDNNWAPIPNEQNQSQTQKSLSKTLKKEKSRKRWLQVFAYTTLASIAGLTLLCVWLWHTYTTAIPEKIVPQIKGLSQLEAQKLLKSQQLTLEIKGYRTHPTYPENTIIESRPPVGRRVKANRTIQAYLSKGKGLVRVPDITGLSHAEVDTLLQEKSLSIEVIDEQFSFDFPEGVVISQSPTPNTFLVVSDNIQVTLSRGFPINIKIQPATTSFFRNKNHLRKVSIQFSSADTWINQGLLEVFYVKNNRKEKIYGSEISQEQEIDLSFELERSGIIDIYWDNELVVSKVIEDEPESRFTF